MRDLRKQIAGLHEELRKAKAAAALPQIQELIRVRRASASLNLLPRNLPF
jgi:hypothetical protein